MFFRNDVLSGLMSYLELTVFSTAFKLLIKLPILVFFFVSSEKLGVLKEVKRCFNDN